MKWSWVALGSVVVLGACESSGKPAPRGLKGPDGQPIPQAAIARAEESQHAAAEPFPSAPFPDLPSSGATNTFPALPAPAPTAAVQGEGKPAQGSQTSAAEITDKAERDLAKEVAALLPAPAKCIDLAKVAADGGKLTIGITAYALPGGSFSRVSVSAPGQSPEAVKCLQSMVEHGSIAPDVPNAPRAIQASVPVEVVAQAQTAPARPTPPPLPSNIARPVPGEIARPDGNTIAQPSQ